MRISLISFLFIDCNVIRNLKIKDKLNRPHHPHVRVHDLLPFMIRHSSQISRASLSDIFPRRTAAFIRGQPVPKVLPHPPTIDDLRSRSRECSPSAS